jgi:predicted lipopolysaccharide heptosyltransferase III
VLIIRLRSFGDVLLITPALRALKQWRADLRISVLMYEEFAPALAGNADVEEVVEWEPKGPRSALSLWRLIRALRQRKFAACFNLHGNTISALLSRSSGAAHRVAPAWFPFPWAYTARSPQAELVLGRTGLHSVEDRMAPFYWAGLPPGEIPRLQVVVQMRARQLIQEKLARAGVPSGARYAVLHPAVRFATKEWPLERYPALSEWLTQQHGIVSVFSCGPDEAEKLDRMARLSHAPFVRVDPMSFQELAALIEGAAVFIGPDSGPMHVAAALGRPVVAIWGSSNATVWSPWRTPHVIVQNYYPCNPCPGDRCYAFSQPECVLSVRLEQVSAAVDQVLGRQGSAEEKSVSMKAIVSSP